MNKGLRAIFIVGAVVAAIWLVSAIGFTLVRTDCLRPLTERCNNGVIDAYGDVVQLGWVKEFQTLIAGVLALLAGSFVYVAARFQATDADRKEAKERRRKVIGALTIIRTQFLQYRSTLKKLDEPYGFPDPKMRETLDTAIVRSQVGLLGPENNGLGEFILAALGTVDEVLANYTGGLRSISQRQPKKALAECVAMAAYLKDPDRILDRDGAFTMASGDGDELYDQLQNWGCRWKDLVVARMLFTEPDFDKER